MNKSFKHAGNSLSEVHETVDVTQQKRGWRRFLAFAGPAYLVSVGYMDPGNWATDLQGGAQFGYRLIWVLLMSNLMALLLQSLSARLGIVRRRDLAQANRETYPPAVNFCLYILAELAIAATDLAEVLGMAIGIHLLTGIPILWGVVITVLDTFLLLSLQRYGIRRMEAFIISLVAIIGVSFLVEIIFAKPDLGEVMTGFVPSSLSGDSLYIAVGIIGATVMPHNLYLHSALVQTRKIDGSNAGKKQALRYNFFDSFIALNAAFFVNAAILVLAATVFFKTGNTHVAKIEDAHQLMAPLLGTKLAPILFAIALIAAGQSSTVTGTLAGQIVMEGYLNLRINPLIRRLITRIIAILPAVIVIAIYGDQQLDALLILSQVVLSLQLGFAIIPLIHFVSDKKMMGVFAIKWPVKLMAWSIALVLVFLNAKLVTGELLEVFESGGSIWKMGLLALVILAFIWLFCMMTFYPLTAAGKRHVHKFSMVHKDITVFPLPQVPAIRTIAVTLDFTERDKTVLAHAIQQGKQDAQYLLIHIVESAGAKLLGAATNDLESQDDLNRLEAYAEHLRGSGYNVNTVLGFQNRVKEIIRLVQEGEANMLVMGGHRHKGIKDYIYGETIDAVRHELDIPVLIVNPLK
ncbi:MAG TPA: Nramp family divalent metal transporter [Phnomibacter sp.]|nr:Nramp family divalent metal transporter [Phnomibacter sp.]